MTSALITGAAGQDGILLAQYLVADGYDVTGLVKPGTDTSTFSRYAPTAAVVECDLGDRQVRRPHERDGELHTDPAEPREVAHAGLLVKVFREVRLLEPGDSGNCFEG